MLARKMQDCIAAESPIRRASHTAQRLAERDGADNVFDFSIGNPGALPPAEVTQAIRDLAEVDQHALHSYMPDPGFADVRADIAADLNERFDLGLDEDGIIMSVGAAGAMNLALCATVDPGDEVIVFRPYYPGYPTFFKVWGATMVPVDAIASTLQPDLEDLRSKITERTKMVFVNSPNNPCGVIYTQETAEGIASILEDAQERYGHEIYLLSDEPYRELVYIDEQLPVWMKVYDNTFMAYSFSKSLSIPGERIGYLAINPRMADARSVTIASRQALGMMGFVNAPAMQQRIAQRCLGCAIDMDYYRRNLDFLYGNLTSMGFEMLRPMGAFYLFIEAPDGDEVALMQACLDHNVILVEGSAFGMPGYARLSFCISFEIVERSMPAFRKVAAQLGILPR